MREAFRFCPGEQMQEFDPSELIQTLLDSAPGDEFWFERGGKRGKVRVQLLRIDEDHQVLAEAQKYAKDMGETPKEYGDLYRNAQAVGLVARCLRHTQKRQRADGTEYYPPLFVDEKTLRQSFTEAEIAQVLNMYELVKAKFGAVKHFSEEDLEAWAARLGDTLRGAYFLPLLDSSQWPELILSLAQQVCALRESLGRPLPSWQDTFESTRESSDTGTGSFSELPSAASSDQSVELPTDKLLDKASAAKLAKKILKK
jgi:hypothetical protein